MNIEQCTTLEQLMDWGKTIYHTEKSSYEGVVADYPGVILKILNFATNKPSKHDLMIIRCNKSL